MKLTLLILIVTLSLNLTSAFLWFSSLEKVQPKQATTTRTTRLTSLNTQQQNRPNNSADRFRQVVFRLNNKNSSRSPLQRVVNQRQQTASMKPNNSATIPRNRFGALVYQQQPHRSLNNGNSRVFNLGFRSASSNSFSRQMTPSVSPRKSNVADAKPNSSSILKNNNNSQQSGYPRAAAAASKQIRLLSALNTKTNDKNQSNDQNRQNLLARAYYHEQLRDFYRHVYEQQVAYDRRNGKQVLNRKSRDDGSKVAQSDFYPMILARNIPSDNQEEY